MKISVVIPVLNEEDRIAELMQAVRAHATGYVDEMIVVDGGSCDNTLKIARESGAVTLSSQRGRGRQMNHGADKAASEVLYFLHADTIPPPGFDKVIIDKVLSGYSAGCFRLRFDWEHPMLKFYSLFTRFKTTLVRFGDQSLFVEKSLFKKIDGFEENLIVMEDQKIVRELKKWAPFTVCKNEVITSARKYREVGAVKLQILFFLIWFGYYLGVSQENLTSFYKRKIRPIN
jgi:rSAM/selenodomain-associated transferase 2